MAQRGRPSDYDPTLHPAEAYRLCLLGYTDDELARSFGVSNTTIRTWKKTHEDFLRAVKEGKELADAKVAESLFKRATGYEYPSEKIVTLGIGNGESVVERVPITAVVLPDPGAALNWLKNRQPDKWRDKQQVELSGEVSVTLNLDGEPNKQVEE